MKKIFLTVFDETGNTLLDESFLATDFRQAKNIATRRLIQEGYQSHTHRLVTEDGRLILFQR